MSSTDIVIHSPSRTVLCAHQNLVEIAIGEFGNVELIQSNWPDDDSTIRITRDNVDAFLERLTDSLGIGSVGRSV
jgi:hypothetical protein